MQVFVVKLIFELKKSYHNIIAVTVLEKNMAVYDDVMATDFVLDFFPWASCQIRKIAGAHAPGMPGTFSPSPQLNDPDMHHGTCVTHVPWCMPGSLPSGFLCNRRRGKRSRHSRRMRNLQFYVSGKKPIVCPWTWNTESLFAVTNTIPHK